MAMSLSKVWKIVKERESWCAAVCGVAKSQTWLNNNMGKDLISKSDHIQKFPGEHEFGRCHSSHYTRDGRPSCSPLLRAQPLSADSPLHTSSWPPASEILSVIFSPSALRSTPLSAFSYANGLKISKNPYFWFPLWQKSLRQRNSPGLVWKANT